MALYAQEINTGRLLSYGTPDQSGSGVWDTIVDTAVNIPSDAALAAQEIEEWGLLQSGGAHFMAEIGKVSEADIAYWFLKRYIGKVGKDGCTCGLFSTCKGCPASRARTVYIRNNGSNVTEGINSQVINLIYGSNTYKRAGEYTKDLIQKSYEDNFKNNIKIPETFGTRRWRWAFAEKDVLVLFYIFRGMHGNNETENGTKDEPNATFSVKTTEDIKNSQGVLVGKKYKGNITYHQKDFYDFSRHITKALGYYNLARNGLAAEYWIYVDIDQEFSFTVPRGVEIEKVLDQYKQLRKKATVSFLQNRGNIDSVKPVFDEIGKIRLDDCPKDFRDAFMKYAESVRFRILETPNLTNMSSTQALQTLGQNSRNVEENVQKMRKICEKYDVKFSDLD
ncbi:MAG: hypothetical protein LBJ67_03535 [Planctomycetaceae bacterium]|jgi:hypothetical protein|nr:hypothetical protein [Planctomycetaceae bacterium]